MLDEMLKLLKYKSWANELTFTALSEVAAADLYKQRQTNFNSQGVNQKALNA